MMKPPMPKGGEVKMGGHASKEPKMDRADTADLKAIGKPHGGAKPASRADQLRSGGPGVGANGGMAHAVKTLSKMKV